MHVAEEYGFEIRQVRQGCHIADLRVVEVGPGSRCKKVDSNQVAQPIRSGGLFALVQESDLIDLIVIPDTSARLRNPLNHLSLPVRSMNEPTQPQAADRQQNQERPQAQTQPTELRLGPMNDVTESEYSATLQGLPCADRLSDVLEDSQIWCDEDDDFDSQSVKFDASDFLRLRLDVCCLPGDEAVEFTTFSMCSDDLYVYYAEDARAAVRDARDETRQNVESVVAAYNAARAKLVD